MAMRCHRWLRTGSGGCSPAAMRISSPTCGRWQSLGWPRSMLRSRGTMRRRRWPICGGSRRRYSLGCEARRRAPGLFGRPRPTSASGQVAPAIQLGLARLRQLEIARLDRADGLVVRYDHAGRVGLRLEQLQADGNRPIAEDALAAAEYDGEGQQTEF